MKIDKFFIIILLFGIGFLGLALDSSFGHGLGYEVLPPVKLGDKQVSLEVTSSQYSDPESTDRAITFSLFDIKTGITIKEVTYHIIAKKGNQPLFEETFKSSDGNIVMNFVEGESNNISMEKETKSSDIFGFLLGDSTNTVTLKGAPFKTGGLYSFKVNILTAGKFSDNLENPIQYDVGLSIPDRGYYTIVDPNFGKQELSLITYYDTIENFDYDQDTKSLTFHMPFVWDFNNINQTSVVHEELIIPKTFGELMVSEISAFVNGIELGNHVITIDDFSEKTRIIHLVINQQDLFDLLEKNDEDQNGMEFLIKPSARNLPLKTITGNGQFGIHLSWEPYNLKSGSEATFYFNILDVFLKDRPVMVPYELKILHNGDEIYSESGMSSGSKEQPNTINFIIPDDVDGPITFQFENLDGNVLARVGLPVVVNRVIQENISIPNWVKNNAGWWSQDQIKDSDFATGIEFLIKEGIIIVPTSEGSQSGSEKIPDWVKNNAGWWSEGLISDKEFANGIQFLIKNSIISV